MKKWTSIGTAATIALFGLLAGCGSSAPATTTGCTPGQSVACTATSGCAGAQICASSGQEFGPCTCTSDGASSSGGSSGSGVFGASSSGSGSGGGDDSGDDSDGTTADGASSGTDSGDATVDAAPSGSSSGDATVSGSSSSGSGSESDATASGSSSGGPLDTDGSVSEADGGDAPAGSAGAAAYCAVACARVSACLDASTCSCTVGALPLTRSDYAAGLTTCESETTCAEVASTDGGSDSALETCETNVLTSITPTAAVTTLCTELDASSCAVDMISDCTDTLKVYSDVTIDALAECLSEPCSEHSACFTAALTPGSSSGGSSSGSSSGGSSSGSSSSGSSSGGSSSSGSSSSGSSSGSSSSGSSSGGSSSGSSSGDAGSGVCEAASCATCLLGTPCCTIGGTCGCTFAILCL